jgi:hypothetical protein
MGRGAHKETKDYAGFFKLSTRNKIYTGKQVVEKNPTIQIICELKIYKATHNFLIVLGVYFFWHHILLNVNTFIHWCCCGVAIH